MAPFSTSSLKSPYHYSLHHFSIKPASSSSSSSSFHLLMKTLFHTFLLPHMSRVTGPIAAKAKSFLLKLLKDIQYSSTKLPLLKKKNKKHNKGSNKHQSKKKPIYFGSFRLHYNWCSSSHVMPLTQEIAPCRPTEEIVRQEGESEGDDGLWKYLEWLEESKGNEIDRLADLFIANCHEKFRLEKQESYRRFQEMMARSV